jgi:hypothetical protein
MHRILRFPALIAVMVLFLVSCKPFADFKAKFTNQLFTDIEITVQNYGTKTISPGATVTFDIYSRDGDYSFYAKTCGKNSDGDQLGQLVEWDYTLNIAGDEHTTDLITDGGIFFIKMRNEGTHTLTPLYVNYDSADQTVDNIIIPHNGVTYAVGYYHAFINTKVKAYWQDAPTNYTYWLQGTHFNLPFANNQSVTLLNNLKSGGKGAVEGSCVITSDRTSAPNTDGGPHKALPPTSVK